MKLLKLLPIAVLIGIVVSFFYPFILQGKLPLPTDTIVGLYHPYRDYYAKDYPRGVPFKNSLITDPVRQQYPWKYLTIEQLKKGQLPLWNPYSFSGTPLLANFQTGAFYPLNTVFFILPFDIAWGIFILLQQILAGLFMFLFLKNLKLSSWAAFLGSFVWSFCGFSIAWLEWGTIVHTALWLPLLLLAIDKVFAGFYANKSNIKDQILKIQIKNKKFFVWTVIYLFALSSSFFAGHLQTFFYIYMCAIVYFFFRWWSMGKSKKLLLLYLIFNTLYLISISVQLIPTLQFIAESARDIDQLNNWQKEGWFVPWQHLIQFIAPDFFGNPTTLNYWGVWNYGEFVGYIGIFPFILVFLGLLKRNRDTVFFGAVLFASFLLALPTGISQIPFLLHLPFISNTQPTRLMILIDFSLCILAAYGFDQLLKNNKKIFSVVVPFILLCIGLWVFVLTSAKTDPATVLNIEVTKQNLKLPTALLGLSVILLIIYWFGKARKNISSILLIVMLGITVFDLLRFAAKFTPFSAKKYLYPQTKSLRFLENNIGSHRYMTTDRRILTPNFSIMYNLQSIDGYDPLYLLRYGELVAASQRQKPDITVPLGFNRIIQPENYNSPIINLLGVKYVLSLNDINFPKLKKVFQEAETRIYENKAVLPRAFFVNNIKVVSPDKQKSIQALFSSSFNPKETALIETFSSQIGNLDYKGLNIYQLSSGASNISKYMPNYIVINTDNNGFGFLVLTDVYYSTWKAYIDGKETKVYRSDYNFRGVFIPPGKHTIEYVNSLF